MLATLEITIEKGCNGGCLKCLDPLSTMHIQYLQGHCSERIKQDNNLIRSLGAIKLCSQAGCPTKFQNISKSVQMLL